MKIEFKVASNFGQEEHINKVQVEESGMLLWAEIPPNRLEIEESGMRSCHTNHSDLSYVDWNPIPRTHGGLQLPMKWVGAVKSLNPLNLTGSTVLLPHGSWKHNVGLSKSASSGIS